MRSQVLNSCCYENHMKSFWKIEIPDCTPWKKQALSFNILQAILMHIQSREDKQGSRSPVPCSVTSLSPSNSTNKTSFNYNTWKVLPVSSRRDHSLEGNWIREMLMFIVPQWFMKPPEQNELGRERTRLRKSWLGLRSRPICSDVSSFHLLLRWFPTHGRAEAQMGGLVWYTHCLYLPTAAKRKWEKLKHTKTQHRNHWTIV